MDVLQAFDTLKHNLLVDKLEAYRFRKNVLTYMNNYLSNMLQWVLENISFSGWDKIFSKTTKVPR